METTYQGKPAFYPKSVAEWRQWLEENHQTTEAVWLILYKKDSGIPSISYSESVDEALCFGWVDSKPNKRDEQSFYRYFSQRNPKSNWSKINKQKIDKLIQADKMAPAGLKMIEEAKANGSWTILDEIEEGILPEDLRAAFAQNKTAFKYWEAFPRSVKRNIMEWIVSARRAETRQKRIEETVSLASENKRANQYNG